MGDVVWSATRLEAMCGLWKLTAEQTGGGKWRWTATKGSRLLSGTEARKGDAMHEAVEAARAKENGHARA